MLQHPQQLYEYHVWANVFVRKALYVRTGGSSERGDFLENPGLGGGSAGQNRGRDAAAVRWRRRTVSRFAAAYARPGQGDDDRASEVRSSRYAFLRHPAA